MPCSERADSLGGYIRGYKDAPLTHTTRVSGAFSRLGSGADTRIRTEDLLFTKQLLYR